MVLGATILEPASPCGSHCRGQGRPIKRWLRKRLLGRSDRIRPFAEARLAAPHHNPRTRKQPELARQPRRPHAVGEQVNTPSSHTPRFDMDHRFPQTARYVTSAIPPQRSRQSEAEVIRCRASSLLTHPHGQPYHYCDERHGEQQHAEAKLPRERSADFNPRNGKHCHHSHDDCH